MADVAFVLHGHFYQPPRENPWTETVPREPSAAPFHDWNARITAECYRPNGWARILDDNGRIVAIVDNYERLSFNVGPTLMSWLDEHAPEVYARIVDADRRGRRAIAQAYGHAILPLCNDRDLRTQVRWGLADFRHRFGRPPEGMGGEAGRPGLRPVAMTSTGGAQRTPCPAASGARAALVWPSTDRAAFRRTASPHPALRAGAWMVCPPTSRRTGVRHPGS